MKDRAATLIEMAYILRKVLIMISTSPGFQGSDIMATRQSDKLALRSISDWVGLFRSPPLIMITHSAL